MENMSMYMRVYRPIFIAVHMHAVPDHGLPCLKITIIRADKLKIVVAKQRIVRKQLVLLGMRSL